MTAAALAFPSGPTVAGFWQQLHAFHPSSLLLAHLSLLRAECLVQCESTAPLDRLERLTLEGLALASQTGTGLSLFSVPVFQAVVHRLESHGLVSNSKDQHWKLTVAGEQATRAGRCAVSIQERRVLHFHDNADSDKTPTFIDLHPPPGGFETLSEERIFDVASLRACVNRSEEWKRLHGFPAEIKAVLEPARAGEAWTESDWPRVILVRAIRLVLALIRARPMQREERVIGFAVRPRDGHLFPNAILDRPAGDPSLPHEWNGDPAPEHWRQAWREWAKAHQIGDAESASCSVEHRGHCLVIQVPQELWDRWRSARVDPTRGESWLLAGDGSVRAAAELKWASAPKKR